MCSSDLKAGLSVVYNALYPVGTLDHSSAIGAIKAQQPDWIYVTGYVNDLVLFRKQMAELKLDAPIVTMLTGPAQKEFVDNLGPLAENVTSATWWHPSQTYKADDVFGTTQVFADAIRARAKQEPDYVHASSAAALIVLQKAIEKAGSLDRDRVREALRTLSINTFYGPIKFREDGMNENRNLPGFVVLGKTKGNFDPTKVFGAAFLPAEFQSTYLPGSLEEPIPNLKPALSADEQRAELGVLAGRRLGHLLHDPERPLRPAELLRVGLTHWRRLPRRRSGVELVGAEHDVELHLVAQLLDGLLEAALADVTPWADDVAPDLHAHGR